jgi:carboxymethylenebutenolidase
MPESQTPMRLARRGFLMTTLISGFSLAAVRGQAAAIHTDDTGLVAGPTTIRVSDGKLPAYFARPAGPGPFPVILVTEEIFGVHEYIKDVCRRFAKLGYLAVAPEYYARLGDLAAMTDPHQIITQVISRAPDAQMMDDMDHAVAWAAAHHGDTNRLGIVGFCRGGRQVWLYAAHSTRLKAAVAFYGPLAGHPSPIQPHTALDLAGQIHCPLLAFYGGKDTGIPPADRAQAAATAKAAGETVNMVVYPDAEHGFHADYRPSYNATAAKDAWAKALAWFQHYGV